MHKTVLFLVIALVLIISCNNTPNNNNTPKQETPKALQDDKINIKSYVRASEDLMEDLYAELVDKDPALKQLEEDLNAVDSKSRNLNEIFQKYNGKSTSYYSTVNYKTATIKDSLLKNKMLTIIAKSSAKYAKKSADIEAVLKQISKNEGTLNEHHTALKVLLTLPLIEQFQNNNKPSLNDFKEQINQQKKLIFTADSLMPKY